MSKYNENLSYLIQDIDISKDELNEIIIEADRIISDTNSEKDKLIEAYLKKVQCLQKLDKHTESKEFIDKLLTLNPNMPEAHVRLGIFYNENEDYDKAIVYATKAIDLKKDYDFAYSRRGFFYYKKKNYKGAIEDYTKAIEINPNYTLAYHNRGIAKSDLPEPDYDGAIKDYTQAIKINPYFAPAYHNRGVEKSNLPEPDYKGAIEDYTKVIEIDPNDASAYNNRGDIYVKMNNYKDAAKNFSTAGTDILNVLNMYDNKELIDFMLDDDIFFKEAIKRCKKREIKDYKDIYIKSLKIISALHIKDRNEMPVSHYTKKDISEKLFFKDYFKDKDGKCEPRSIFRLNSVNTSNDPEEGKTLFHYLFSEKDISLQVEEFGAFAGCFILNNDSLNQFRLYGKSEDKEEGTGVSIALKNVFFSDKISISVEMKSESEGIKGKNSPNLLPLFRCIYIDPETNKVISLGQKEEYVFHRENKTKKVYKKYKKEIDKKLTKISKELEELKKQIENKNLDSDIVHKLLLNLRYLVKHVAFKEEQECRIVQIKKLNDKEKVIADENNRLFVEYSELKPEYVSEICFAPKAKNIDKFKQHLARHNYKVKCYKSKAPLA